MAGCYTPRPITYSVDNNGCHICTSHKNKVKGYPMITRNGKNSQTMIRYLWELKNGPIPEGLEMCHTCDHPYCINPDHAWAGTHKENILDMVRKGRRNPNSNGKGEKNSNSKLTDNLVKHIRQTVFRYGQVKEFCQSNNITTALFYMVKKGKIWNHV